MSCPGLGIFLKRGFNLLFLCLTVTLEQPQQRLELAHMCVLKPGSSRLDGLTVGLPLL